MATFSTHTPAYATRIKYPRISRRAFLGGTLGAVGALGERAVPLAAAPAAPTPANGVAPALQPATLLSGYTGFVKGLAWSPDSTRLASFDDGDDHLISLSTADSATTQRLAGHVGLPHSVAFSPNGTLLATGALSDNAHIWGADGTPRTTVESQGNVRWSPDGAMLATDAGLGGEVVKLWDPSGKTVASLPPKPDNAVTAMSFTFSPNSGTVAIGTSAFDVRLYRPNGSLVRKLGGFEDFVQQVAYSPDGTLLAAGSFDHTARIYRADGTPVAVLKHNDSVATLAWSPDGTTLATGADAVYLWRADGSRVAKLADGTDVPGWSPDGTTLAAAHDDTIHLYRPNGERAAVLAGHSSTVLVLAWSPDGMALASGSRDRTVRIWR